MRDDDFIAGIILGSITGLVITLTVLGGLKLLPNQMQNKFHVEAVAEGHAKWVVEPDGSVYFEWIDCSND